MMDILLILVTLVRIIAWVFVALAAFVGLCGLIGAFDKTERVLLVPIGFILIAFAYALFTASARMAT